jgi:hypothetical protein
MWLNPTPAQEDYAEALVEQLRDEQQFEADDYARKVEDCQDRHEMSELIDEMKDLLAEIRGQWR